MADEVTVTDVTNSDPVIQTDASVATEPSSSTTPATEADPLDAPSILGDVEAKPEGEADGDADKDGDKGGEGDEGKDEAPALLGAPEGDYTITGLPEGVAINTDLLAAATPALKELGLSDAGASKLAANFAEHGLPIIEKQVMDNFIGQVVAQRQAWDSETTMMVSGGKNAAGEPVAADPAFQGKPMAEVRAIAAKALDRFAGDAKFTVGGVETDFRTWLKDTGNGNNPALVRFAYLAGSAISEDMDFERSGDIPKTPKSREEKYYPPS